MTIHRNLKWYILGKWKETLFKRWPQIEDTDAEKFHLFECKKKTPASDPESQIRLYLAWSNIFFFFAAAAGAASRLIFASEANQLRWGRESWCVLPSLRLPLCYTNLWLTATPLPSCNYEVIDNQF